jgi:DNA-binding CsgD family transcriptional regulator
VSGDDLPGIASMLAISVETVRCHLKSIVAKTWTHRQAELVQQLMRVAT